MNGSHPHYREGDEEKDQREEKDIISQMHHILHLFKIQRLIKGTPTVRSLQIDFPDS